jgi:two-component sensor histidine kinase
VRQEAGAISRWKSGSGKAQQATWKRVLREPTATPAAKRTQLLHGVCDGATKSPTRGSGDRVCDRTQQGQPVLLEAKRCWRAKLIVSELVTNASRHAFVGQTGRILVVVKTLSGQVICRVGDNGSSAATLKRGLGTELIDALATDLEGYVERLHRTSGTVVTLRFPQEIAKRSTALSSIVKRDRVD